MNACILTIGNELLQGFTIDTNSAWIGKILSSYDIQIQKILTISDDHDAIMEASRKILDEKFDYFFVTGGLGPTHDDVTKNAFCELFSDEMYLDKKYYSQLIEKTKNITNKFPIMNKSQAMLLKKAEMINNSHGSALGIHYVNDQTHVFIMPGVPIEMKQMMKKIIIPKYMKHNPTNNLVTINTTGIMESQLAENIEPLIKKYSDICDFAFLPSYSGVSFRIHLKNISHDFKKIINEFHMKMQPYSYGFDKDTLEGILGEKLIKKNLTIATAESCTGGLIGKRLTDIPGSSNYFMGGIIAYSNKLKNELLGVPNEIIKSDGAVSEAVALRMAEGIRIKTKADIGISTTGISGPSGGNKTKPVGLVYIGLCSKNISKVKKFTFKIKRSIHREITATTALNITRLALDDKI